MSIDYLAWLQAARLPSHIKIFFPLLFGQALAYSATGQFDPGIFMLSWLCAGLEQLYIVFWNDVADEAADRANSQPMLWAGGSRVIPEGRLSARTLWRAGAVCAVILLLIGLIFTVLYGRKWTLPLFIGGLSLPWMYSFPPLKLNYRGMGEVLQGIGCGVMLPVVGFYLQAGGFDRLPWLLLIPFFLFHWTSSIATALPDREADVAAMKRTVPVMLGNIRAGWMMNALVLLGLLISLSVVDPLSSLAILVSSLILPGIFLGFNVLVTERLSVCRRAMFQYGGLVILLCVFYALGFCISSFAGW